MNTEQAGGIKKALSIYTEGCRSITVNMSRGVLYGILADNDIVNNADNVAAADNAAASSGDNSGSYTGSITELFAGRPDCSVIVMSSAGMTAERMARHFGCIGKNLDEAYKAGKFTEDEYNGLNVSLDEYMENIISRNEQTLATRAVMQQEWKDRMANKGVQPLSLEETEKKRAAAVAEYIKTNGIDREALKKMSREIRVQG
ncbi:MAG: hypothetical protein K2K57_08745 [Oscillospiraceae bacterium]|nr:hypothetical protein [Oscillospiraceae bacterium]